MTAQPILTARSIGDAVARICQAAEAPDGGHGEVLGCFSSGFYVRAGHAVFAVAGPEIPPGPIHLVLDAAPPPPPETSMVRLAPDRLTAHSCGVDLSRAVRYRPDQPSPERLRKIAPLLTRLDPEDAPPCDVAQVWEALRAAVGRSDLQGARALLQGLGSGLTPTGDDLLAGLLLFAHWAEPGSTLPGEVAYQAATTDLSRGFLASAAAGQSIQPVHDLLAAAEALAESETAEDRFSGAVDRVAAIGHSSGAALLAGLGLAATAWPTQA